MIGCAGTSSAPQVVVDPTIPQVTELKSLSGISEIGLEWKPIYSERVKGYYIYRSDSNKQKLERIATIKDRYASHYLDEKLKPATFYKYKMSAYATNGKESVSSNPISISTKNRPEPVPFVQAIADLPNRIKIIWRPHPFVGITSYVIQRKRPTEQKWRDHGKVKGRLSAEYIDNGLLDNKAFQYRVLAKTDNGILTKPSQVVSGITKPLPPTIINLRATRNEPKKIVITWDPVISDDIAYYKVYSSPTSMLLFSYLAKTKNTRFEDLINTNDKTRYYKVTVVDKDDLESLKQDDAVEGRTLPAPKAPVVVSTSNNGFEITIKWSDGGVGVQSYEILKEINGKSELIRDIQGTSYIDTNLIPNAEYTYKVYAIDKYGLRSDPSDDVDLSTKGGTN